MEPIDPLSPSLSEDAAIGVALRRSLIILLLIGGLAGAAIWWFSRPEPMNQSLSNRLAAPFRREVESTVRPPKVPFSSVDPRSGVAFVHQNGAEGAKLLPETMGGGIACFDFDNDGDVDLLFINSNRWAESKLTAPKPLNGLFRNDTVRGGPWHFTDVTSGSGLDTPFYGMGVSCADFDGDDLRDVLITGVGGIRLFKNKGAGKFKDITAASGLPSEGSDWCTAAAWFDADNDGDLDLFIGRYVVWSPELDREVNNQLVGIGRAYGRPWNFPGTFPSL